MTFDLSLEYVCRKLSSRARAFTTSLKTISDSDSYSKLVAALLQAILTGEPEGQLWSTNLDFHSCLSILPSELFPVPVPTYFYRRLTVSESVSPTIVAGDALRPHPSFRRRNVGPHLFFLGIRPHKWFWEDSPYSFFGIDVTTDPLIEVHFPGRRVPVSSERSHTRRPNVFFVTDDMIDYLYDSAYEIPFSASDFYNLNDPRLKRFLRRHGSALKSLLHHHSGLAEIGPDSIIEPEYDALWEILNIRNLSPTLSDHAYIVPGMQDAAGRGAFCYFFTRPLSDLERAFLRFTSDRIFSFLREHDRSEAARRIAAKKTLVPFTPADFHSLGNAMGTTFNYLRSLQNDKTVFSSPPAAQLLAQAISSHQEAFQYINRAQEQSTPLFSWGPRFRLQQLLLVWIARWKPSSQYLFELASHQLQFRFSLSGPENELASAVYQFLEVPLYPSNEDQLDEYNYRLDEDQRPRDTVLNLSIDEPTSSLRILVFNGSGFSDWSEYALRTVTLFDRLPSHKPDGGKGILSSILSIRDRFHGQCTYSEHHGNHWRISIPIQIARRRASKRTFANGA